MGLIESIVCCAVCCPCWCLCCLRNCLRNICRRNRPYRFRGKKVVPFSRILERLRILEDISRWNQHNRLDRLDCCPSYSRTCFSCGMDCIVIVFVVLFGLYVMISGWVSYANQPIQTRIEYETSKDGLKFPRILLCSHPDKLVKSLSEPYSAFSSVIGDLGQSGSSVATFYESIAFSLEVGFYDENLECVIFSNGKDDLEGTSENVNHISSKIAWKANEDGVLYGGIMLLEGTFSKVSEIKDYVKEKYIHEGFAASPCQGSTVYFQLEVYQKYGVSEWTKKYNFDVASADNGYECKGSGESFDCSCQFSLKSKPSSAVISHVIEFKAMNWYDPIVRIGGYLSIITAIYKIIGKCLMCTMDYVQEQSWGKIRTCRRKKKTTKELWDVEKAMKEEWEGKREEIKKGVREEEEDGEECVNNITEIVVDM